MDKPTLITICARGGSKGLPGKHMRMMHGWPLIHWTLSVAIMWEGLAHARGQHVHIAVSSDDKQLLAYAASHSNRMLMITRDPNLATDTAGKLDVIRNAVCCAEAWSQPIRQYGCVIDLDICNPMRTVMDVEKAYQQFVESKRKCLVSVTPARKTPDFNMVRDIDGMTHVMDGGLKTRRQDTDRYWDLNCNIYIYNPFWLFKHSPHTPLHAGMGIYGMPDHTRHDIDTLDDFKIVELMMKEHGYI